MMGRLGPPVLTSGERGAPRRCSLGWSLPAARGWTGKGGRGGGLRRGVRSSGGWDVRRGNGCFGRGEGSPHAARHDGSLVLSHGSGSEGSGRLGDQVCESPSQSSASAADVG